MAITTTQQKFAMLSYNLWTVSPTVISSDGIGSDDKKMFLRGYPTQAYAGEIDEGVAQFITRFRRRGRR